MNIKKKKDLSNFQEKYSTQITGFANLSSHQQGMRRRSFLETKGVDILLKENKLLNSELFTTQNYFKVELR